MFIFLVFHQHLSRDWVHRRMFFGRNTSRTVIRKSSIGGIYVSLGGIYVRVGGLDIQFWQISLI